MSLHLYSYVTIVDADKNSTVLTLFDLGGGQLGGMITP